MSHPMKRFLALLILPFITAAATAQEAGLRDLTRSYSALEQQARVAQARALAAAAKQADFNRANQLLNEMVLSIMAANGIAPAGAAPARIEENDEFQAYSAGDGSIVVYTGLLERVPDDEELAFVLGHEIAHWTLHHAYYRRIEDRMMERARWYYYLHGMTVESMQLQEARAMESEADRQGMLYAAKAGYDVSRVGDFFVNVARYHKTNPRHPLPQTRGAELQKFVPGAQALRKSAPVDNLAEIQKLIK